MQSKVKIQDKAEVKIIDGYNQKQRKIMAKIKIIDKERGLTNIPVTIIGPHSSD